MFAVDVAGILFTEQDAYYGYVSGRYQDVSGNALSEQGPGLNLGRESTKIDESSNHRVFLIFSSHTLSSGASCALPSNLNFRVQETFCKFDKQMLPISACVQFV